MAMQESYCKQMRYSGPESLAPSDATKFDVLIQMEVLAGCEQGCLGCFVDKAIDPKSNQQQAYCCLYRICKLCLECQGWREFLRHKTLRRLR